MSILSFNLSSLHINNSARRGYIPDACGAIEYSADENKVTGGSVVVESEESEIMAGAFRDISGNFYNISEMTVVFGIKITAGISEKHRGQLRSERTLGAGIDLKIIEEPVSAQSASERRDGGIESQIRPPPLREGYCGNVRGGRVLRERASNFCRQGD